MGVKCPALDFCCLARQGAPPALAVLPGAAAVRVMNGGLNRARSLFSPPGSLSFPPWHYGSSSGSGCSGRSLAWEHVDFGDRAGLVLADILPLPLQATGPFLHIGIVGGMTLLAWPLASFIYRTRNKGNPPPRSPSPPSAGALPRCPASYHSMEQHWWHNGAQRE